MKKVGQLYKESHFNAAKESIHNSDRGKSTARNASRNDSITSYMEGEIRVKFARTRAILDVLLGIVGTTTELDSVGEKNLHLLVIGGQSLLKDYDCPAQTGNTDFEVRKGQSIGIVVLVCGSEAIYLSVCSAWPPYEHYPISVNKKLSNQLCLYKVTISAYSAFVGHANLHYGGCGR